MLIDEFQRRLKQALGSTLENATPANVREFVDQMQQELWREDHPRSKGDAAGRIDISSTEPMTYEAVMRQFFVNALSKSRNDSLIQLWLLALDLAYTGIEEMHAERMQALFKTGDILPGDSA